jgi:hypothetical protein
MSRRAAAGSRKVGGPALPMLLAAGTLLGLGAASVLVGSRRRRHPTAGM